jgi:ATP-binding cassette, subfamily B, bacterial
MTALDGLAWRADDFGQLLSALGRASGLCAQPAAMSGERAAPVESGVNDLARSAVLLGFALEPVECRYAELARALSQLGPGIVRVCDDGDEKFYAVVRGGRRRLQLLGPALERRCVRVEALRSGLTRTLEDSCSARVGAWLSKAGIGARQQKSARRELIGMALSERRVSGIWLLRSDAGASFVGQLRERGVLGDGAWAVLLSILQVFMTVCGFAHLGSAAMSGVFELGWIAAWALCVFSTVPLQVAASWLSGRMFNTLAVLLKQRLLAGALRLELSELRSQGSGRLLSVVSEAEVLESSGFAGLFNLVLALLQWLSSLVILGVYARAPALVLGMLGLSAFVGLLFVRALRARAAWTELRFDQDSAFVDHVLGNRTRVVQQPSRSWHARDEQRLEQYLEAERRSDAAQVWLGVLPGRAALLVGCVGLLPLVMQQPADATRFAIALGGVVQAYLAWTTFGPSANTLIPAWLAWQRIAGLFRGATRIADPGHPTLGAEPPPAAAAPPMVASATARTVPVSLPALETRELAFSYRSSARSVLSGCSFALMPGDRALVEGPSGGGKSTLASLLLGLHEPQAGQVLASGLGRETLGAAQWRRRIASAPQFHDNHVLSGTLAFNLLMGRSWPCSETDRAQAQALCRELGLGPLVERMPSGLDQIVGETGWQLSHGERSRVFLARALLQGAEIVVLDETFAALDPVNLRRCVEAARKHAPTLLVIAHY